MKEPITLNLQEANLSVVFQKLGNMEWYKMRQKQVPIFEDYDFLMILDFHHYRERDFDLAKMYMALFTLFGGYNNYDDYKCSFSYKFKLIIQKKKKKYTYGLSMFDMKGNMPYFTYYRKPQGRENSNAYQTPLDNEFSKEEMRLCTITFISFLEGFYLGYKPYFDKAFYRVNRAGYMIYGFKKGKFFVNCYPSEKEKDYKRFQKKITSFEKKKYMGTDMSTDFWD